MLKQKRMGVWVRCFVLLVAFAWLFVAVRTMSSTSEAAGRYAPSDGIDFDGMYSTHSRIFLGAYDHMSGGTYGIGGGVQTREGTARPVLWDILHTGDETMTVFSHYVTDAMTFHGEDGTASFAYSQSDIAAYLASTQMLGRFSETEKTSLLLSQNIATGIYDADNAELLDSQYPGGVTWPVIRSGSKLYLPWAKKMNDFPPQSDRIHFSANGQDPAPISSLDKVAYLRTSLTPTPYWSRSPHLGTGVAPATNEALYIDASGNVGAAKVTDVYGLRPMATVDTSNILLARKITDTPETVLDMASDGILTNGVVSTDGNYYGGERAGGEDAQAYKLTVINDAITLDSLALTEGTQIAADGSTHLAVQGDVPLEFSAVTSGVSTGMAYKVVRSVDTEREIVAYGKTNTYTFALPLTGLDGESPLPQGQYTVYVWANNEKAINSDEASAPAVFTLSVDKTAPTTVLNPESNGTWQKENATVSFNAQDSASGVTALYTKVNEENETIWPGASCTLTLTKEGVHRITYYAKDAAGNVETSNEAMYYIDKTSPKTTIPASGTYTPREIALQAKDPDVHAQDGQVSGVAKISYRINNGQILTYTKPLSLRKAGSYTVQYWAVDHAGNAETPAAAHYIIKNPPTKIKIQNRKAKTLLVGQSYKLGAVVIPAGANREILWESQNPKVATVSYNGRVKALRPGKAIIKAKAPVGGAVDRVTVYVERKVTSVRGGAKTIHLTQGTTVKYPLVAYTKDASKITLTWKAKKYGAATVKAGKGKTLASKGTIIVKGNRSHYIKVKANKPGQTKIVITTRNKKRYVIKAVVHPAQARMAVKSLRIVSVPKGHRLERQKYARLQVQINPAVATNVVAKWKSSNSKVIKVDQTGRLTAVKSGRVTITVKVGKKTAKVKLRVVKWKS